MASNKNNKYMPKHEDINSPAEISDIVHTHILNYIAGLCPKNLKNL